MKASSEAYFDKKRINSFKACWAAAVMLACIMRSSAEPASLELVWQRPVPTAIFMSSSPDGRLLGLITDDSQAILLDSRGVLVWKVKTPDANQIVVGSNGCAVAYTFLNPAYNRLYFITSKGKIARKLNSDGAVWAAAASPKGEQFALGTGGKRCTVYTFSEKRFRFRRWRLNGAPCSVRFSADSRLIAAGTWQDSGIEVFTTDGRKISEFKGEENLLYFADFVNQNNSVIYFARPNRAKVGEKLGLKTLKLVNVWEKELPVISLTVDANPSGRLIAAGFQRIITHKNERIAEKRAALYDLSGKLVWEKGGMFGKWRLMKALANGVVVRDESNIYILDPNGAIEAKYHLPKSIVLSAADPTRRYLTVFCEDGILYRLAIR